MTSGRSRRIRLEVDGVLVSLRVLPPAASEGGGVLPVVISEWLFFSTAEERIVRLLLDGIMSREEIARRLDESAEGKVKTTLAGLASRRVLLTTTDGYAINASSERMAELRTWLDGRAIADPSERHAH